jgi:hypothetical protein
MADVVEANSYHVNLHQGPNLHEVIDVDLLDDVDTRPPPPRSHSRINPVHEVIVIDDLDDEDETGDPEIQITGSSIPNRGRASLTHNLSC